MKNLNFAISFNIYPVIVLATQKVIEVSIGEEVLGYVHIIQNSLGADVCTPFTNESEMMVEDCLWCAAKALFADRTSILPFNIAIAEDEGSASVTSSRIKNLLLSALANGSTSIN